MTTADILRDHALYHKTAYRWELLDLGRQGRRAWTYVAKEVERAYENCDGAMYATERRMFFLFCAESLKD